MDIKEKDILVLKKQHPCGGNRFIVMRAGMDFRIKCESCGSEIWIPRQKLEKRIKNIVKE